MLLKNGGNIMDIKEKTSESRLKLFILRKNCTQFSITNNISSFSLYQTYINSRECPHCGSHQVVSKGNYKKRKRYLCRDCGKSYNDLTKTPFSGIHNLNKISKYLNSMLSGDSIRKAADLAEVSVATSFNWRHKLLNVLNDLPSPNMKNVKEVMELKLNYSHKGQKKKVSKSMMKSKVSAMFMCDRTGKLDSDSILYSNRDYNPLINRIALQSNEHTEIILEPHTKKVDVPGIPSIKSTISSNYKNSELISQKVESWQSWMKRFKGVATKYLRNYMHWYDFLDNSQLKPDKMDSLMQLLFSPFQNNLLPKS